MWPRTSQAVLLASLATLPLAACSTPTPSASGVIGIFEPVPNYAKAPCELQKKWAEHNSKVASLQQWKEVVYKAPCEVDKKPKTEPKVS